MDLRFVFVSRPNRGPLKLGMSGFFPYLQIKSSVSLALEMASFRTVFPFPVCRLRIRLIILPATPHIPPSSTDRSKEDRCVVVLFLSRQCYVHTAWLYLPFTSYGFQCVWRFPLRFHTMGIGFSWICWGFLTTPTLYSMFKTTSNSYIALNIISIPMWWYGTRTGEDYRSSRTSDRIDEEQSRKLLACVFLIHWLIVSNKLLCISFAQRKGRMSRQRLSQQVNLWLHIMWKIPRGPANRTFMWSD